MLSWAEENAIVFDSQKTELVHFPARRQDVQPSIMIRNTSIEPVEYIRWLGVYLESHLTFRQHIATWCGKALKIAQHMRRLNTVRRGAAPGLLVMATNACVVPVAMYGAEVWWPGMTRPAAKGAVTPQTTHLCSLIDRALHLALRAELPVWRTILNAVLHRESGIPPARILLEGNRLRFAARINTLDKSHPLRDRASLCPNVGTLKYKKKAKLSRRPEIQMSRLQRAYRQLPPTFEAAEELAAHVYFENLGTKAEGVEAHNEWVRTISTSDICAYSDGSSEGHGRSSWGYVL